MEVLLLEKMNVLYMHTHDSGRYFEPYGHKVPTPNIMELAQEGTLFRQAFCAAPTCSPSRAALLTGRYPHSVGMLGLAHMGYELKDYNQHLANFLKREGYESVLSGIQHVAHRADEIGYDQIFEFIGVDKMEECKNKEKRDIENAKSVVEYLKSDRDKPFFLSYGMVNTHRAFPDLDNDIIDPNYVKPPFPMYDNENNRRDMAKYIKSAKIADDCVGMIMDALKETGLDKNTIVIFTTDHGIAFPKMKCTLYDSGTGVSLIMNYPDNKMNGRVIDDLVSHVDIFPTLCEILDIEKPDCLEGESFLPLLEGKEEKIREEVFSEVTYHADYEPMRAIRTERYKYIKYFDDKEKYLPENMDYGLSRNFYNDNGYFDLKRPKEELYDLYLDPVERVNLVDEKKYSDIYNKLSGRLKKWMIETADPLLENF